LVDARKVIGDLKAFRLTQLPPLTASFDAILYFAPAPLPSIYINFEINNFFQRQNFVTGIDEAFLSSVN